MPKLVILDDDRMVTLLVKRSLPPAEFEVVAVTDSSQIMPLLEGGPVDLLVTDLMMPQLDGLEVCRLVRHHPKLKSLKVLVLTAKRLTTEERKELLDLGVEIVSKPFVPAALTEKIRGMLA